MLRESLNAGFVDGGGDNGVIDNCMADLQALIRAVKVGPRKPDAVHFMTPSVAWVEQISKLVAAEAR
jgi:hypothetical protein